MGRWLPSPESWSLFAILGLWVPVAPPLPSGGGWARSLPALTSMSALEAREERAVGEPARTAFCAAPSPGVA